MSNQLRFVQGNGCPLCAERAQLSAEIAKFQRTEKERLDRLDRLFQRIERCEAKARELGLYEAKKSE